MTCKVLLMLAVVAAFGLAMAPRKALAQTQYDVYIWYDDGGETPLEGLGTYVKMKFYNNGLWSDWIDCSELGEGVYSAIDENGDADKWILYINNTQVLPVDPGSNPFTINNPVVETADWEVELVP